MPAPTTFPIWMQKAGQPDMYVPDVNGYNAALSMGYTYTSNTPQTVIEQQTGVTDTVVENTVSVGQPDPAEPTQVS